MSSATATGGYGVNNIVGFMAGAGATCVGLYTLSGERTGTSRQLLGVSLASAGMNTVIAALTNNARNQTSSKSLRDLLVGTLSGFASASVRIITHVMMSIFMTPGALCHVIVAAVTGVFTRVLYHILYNVSRAEGEARAPKPSKGDLAGALAAGVTASAVTQVVYHMMDNNGLVPTPAFGAVKGGIAALVGASGVIVLEKGRYAFNGTSKRQSREVRYIPRIIAAITAGMAIGAASCSEEQRDKAEEDRPGTEERNCIHNMEKTIDPQSLPKSIQDQVRGNIREHCHHDTEKHRLKFDAIDNIINNPETSPEEAAAVYALLQEENKASDPSTLVPGEIPGKDFFHRMALQECHKEARKLLSYAFKGIDPNTLPKAVFQKMRESCEAQAEQEAQHMADLIKGYEDL